jgi:hypothetical protein
MTWLERIAAARERGGVFTEEDFLQATDGTAYRLAEFLDWSSEAGAIYAPLFPIAVAHNRVDEAEALLLRAHDLADTYKREMGEAR